MALPFFNGQSKKRDQIIAIDLGGRSTKAIHLQRKGDTFTLLRYCVMDAPIFEKSLSVELLADHLKAIYAALETKTKFVSLAIGVNDSIVRQAELPQIPIEDMRQILKNNTKNYLQQDLPNYTFDCHFMIGRPPGANGESGKASAGPQKYKVLVGGARKQLADDLQAAIKAAGLIADQVVPGLVGPANAFELALPEAFNKDAVALVDIGFKSTSICLLNKGELILSRVVNIGGDKFTSGLAESMGISYAEAEGIKVGMPSEVQSNLEPLLTPLGRELRASVDFFEHQQDRTVSQIYISGGSARSEFIMTGLETELMAPCKAWNPTANLQLALPPMQVNEIEHVAPQLTVAVGTAAAAF
ncbi:MAG: Type pilus assembly protein PilM [Pedosphaera sp.]|nr:Type pilus assembly protein PilM [Pedosphaera sp.]